MGANTHVDLTQLRAVADRVMDAATDIAEMHSPTLDADELRGSAVGGIVTPVLIATRLGDVIANMRGWAVAARLSADAFERANLQSADRFVRR